MASFLNLINACQLLMILLNLYLITNKLIRNVVGLSVVESIRFVFSLLRVGKLS